MEGRRGQVARVLGQVDVLQLELVEPWPDGGHGRAGEAQVLGNRQERHEADVLVDGGQARFACAGGRAEADLVPFEQDHARVGSDVAREDLHERALAGSIGAHEGVDLAGTNADVSRTEGHHGAVVLGNASGLEEDPVFGHRVRTDDRKRKDRAWTSPRPARLSARSI